jgi:hypothetical protein
VQNGAEKPPDTAPEKLVAGEWYIEQGPQKEKNPVGRKRRAIIGFHEGIELNMFEKRKDK